MPSLRGRIFRRVVKSVVGPKFRRAGTSVAGIRALTDFFAESQRIPDGTEITPAAVGDLHAEWVLAPGTRADAAVLSLHGGAFVMGAPATHRELAARLSAAMGTRLLSLDRDLLLSDSLRLADRARSCDVEVELVTFPGMWHVFQASARFVPEARTSIEGMGRFVSSRLGLG